MQIKIMYWILLQTCHALLQRQTCRVRGVHLILIIPIFSPELYIIICKCIYRTKCNSWGKYGFQEWEFHAEPRLVAAIRTL